jgi:hypothetical protein
LKERAGVRGDYRRSGLAAAVDSKMAAPVTLRQEGGGRVVEGHHEEGGGSLCALLARRGGMGKERTVAVTGALQRGTTDSFVAKKWKGKGRGVRRCATPRGGRRREAAGRGVPAVEVGGGQDRGHKGGCQVGPRHSPGGGGVHTGLNPILISNKFKLF